MDQKSLENNNSLKKREGSHETVHRSVKPYQCDHAQSNGRNHNCGKQGIANCNCDSYDKSFEHKTNFQTHITTVRQDIKNYSCDFCHKSFGQKSNLETHITTVHQGIKNYSCDLCDKSLIP